MTTTQINDRRTMLLDFLKVNKVQVTFTKVNGDIRTMNCTLCEDFIPVDPTHNIVSGPRHTSQNVISVYDLDKKDWRSFRIENILETKLL